MLKAITGRRSIRKYLADDVPQTMIEEVLQAGMLAPSSKNRQPWKFIVVRGKAKEEMAEAMRRGMDRERLNPLMPESLQYIDGAEYTLRIMQQAPVVIFILNTLAVKIDSQMTADERISEICNAQSIGAAIENMTLAATELGLGSLWICDTFFAQQELDEWLCAEGELYAALALGYADEAPKARPRRKAEDVIEWRA